MASDKIGNGRSLLLTFDDGPEPIVPAEGILKTLAENGILAEFYVLGVEVQRSPGIVRDMATKGHKVQNHSWSHINLAKAEERDVREEVKKTQEAIKNAGGGTPTKIRPPYGAGGWPISYDPELAKVAREFSLKLENWDIDTRDWARPVGLPPEKVADVKNQLIATKANRPIVLMHVQAATQRDLPAFIKQLKAWGFDFARP
jgi:peptidoglycan/xylan/chitin deacetylase (PgdA/CDA1 family)